MSIALASMMAEYANKVGTGVENVLQALPEYLQKDQNVGGDLQVPYNPYIDPGTFDRAGGESWAEQQGMMAANKETGFWGKVGSVMPNIGGFNPMKLGADIFGMVRSKKMAERAEEKAMEEVRRKQSEHIQKQQHYRSLMKDRRQRQSATDTRDAMLDAQKALGRSYMANVMPKPIYEYQL